MEDDSVMCMAGNMVDRNTDQNGSGVRADASFTLNTVDRHAVAYDARNHRVNGEVSGTLQAKGEGGWSLNYINPVLQSTDLPSWKEFFGNDPRKVGANEYWDDRAVIPTPEGIWKPTTVEDKNGFSR